MTPSIIILVSLLVVAVNAAQVLNISRTDFPPDFFFGAATSAAQTEGSANEGGRGPSGWDHRVKLLPTSVSDANKFPTAIEGYKRYKEDVHHLKNLGVNSYRFSISWSRILPSGNLIGGVNQEGVDHYNKLINELIKEGITPFVTLYHMDLPQALEDNHGGIMCRQFVDDFKDYADLCFKLFGDRVKHWFTINEPNFVAQFGYEVGITPPGRCSVPKDACAIAFGERCFVPAGPCIFGGNSSTEPYIAAHNLILAHATAAKLYQQKYKAQQKGEIGIVLFSQYFIPNSHSKEDKDAARRSFDFYLGWFLNPILYGEYPKRMRERVKERLPEFTKEEKKVVKGSLDFVGINYYSSAYTRNKPPPPKEMLRYTFDLGVENIDSSPSSGMLHGNWPEGLEKLVYYVQKKYKNPKIYISENGIRNRRNDSLPFDVQLRDDFRVNYIVGHLYRLNKAIKNGANVKGYFHWALFDNFEWSSGFNDRFGLYYIDFNCNYTRIPKLSVKWFQDFFGGRQT